MSLLSERFLFLDCQTTGMSPRSGNLLEVAWAVGAAQNAELARVHPYIVQQAEGLIPRRIQEITGLQNEDLLGAVPEDLVFQELQALPERETISTALIHYAQFEKAFFGDLFLRHQQSATLPFQVLCTAQLAKRLFPALPSGNIRAVAGYFGASVGALKRSASHVEATFEIWRALAPELEKRGLRDANEVLAWMNEKPAAPQKKSLPYEYRIEKLTRLAFPESPGIYRMLNKKQEVLYVGKATSLKSRVNSYFRGQKSRDRKKLEMLAQVWNIEFVECGTPLEAALLETDEIKRLNPPYNICLKPNRRPPIFYTKNFSSQTEQQDAHHPLGPFRPFGSIEALRLLCEGLSKGVVYQVFYDEVSSELLLPGFLEFCREQQLDVEALTSPRRCLAEGLRQLRRQVDIEESIEEAETELAEAEEAALEVSSELTVNDVAGKFQRLFLRSANEYRRARRLTRLLNAKVEWSEKMQTHSLEVHDGKILGDPLFPMKAAPWAGLNLNDYDRMSVLLSEIEKHAHRITPLGH